jgi:hypothetical protein|tara:strand:+ start:30 stop:392 length:363 start_codon:yes stop_codon:yes gene_type:complete
MSHSIHALTVKQIISRVRQVFPDAPEAYIMSLINDAINEIGEYSQKSISAKINIVADQMFYNIGDSAVDSGGEKLGINKIYRVDIMDNEGDYIKIPRVLDGEPLMFDMTSESAGIKDPGD